MYYFKLARGLLANWAIYGLALFLPAGTLVWPAAWVFVGAVTVVYIAMGIWIFPKRPDLLDERSKLPLQKGQPLADKVVLILILVVNLAVTVFIPLDVFRWHLLPPPSLAISVLGLVLVLAGLAMIYLCFQENAFAAPVVRYQEERRHSLVDTGVYRFVRHPMYSGAVLLVPGSALWLDSFAAAVLSIFPILLLVIRISIEERLLVEKLQGYEAYRQRVRFRLIPFVW